MYFLKDGIVHPHCFDIVQSMTSAVQKRTRLAEVASDSEEDMVEALDKKAKAAAKAIADKMKTQKALSISQLQIFALKNARPRTSAAECVCETPAVDSSSSDEAEPTFSFTKALQSFSGKARTKATSAPRVSTPLKAKSAVGTGLSASSPQVSSSASVFASSGPVRW